MSPPVCVVLQTPLQNIRPDNEFVDRLLGPPSLLQIVAPVSNLMYLCAPVYFIYALIYENRELLCVIVYCLFKRFSM